MTRPKSVSRNISVVAIIAILMLGIAVGLWLLDRGILSIGNRSTTYAVSDANWFFSPGNWYLDGSGYAQTNNPGAYMKLAFEGRGLALGLDLSILDALPMVDTDYPRLRYRIDAGDWQDVLLTRGQTSISLAQELSPEQHHAVVFFRGMGLGANDRWILPLSHLRITSAIVDGGVLTAPQLLPKRWLVFGDSITEGLNLLGPEYSGAEQDASETWAILTATAFDAEVGVVAFSGQGYARPVAQHRVPEFHSLRGLRTWDQLFDQQPRSFAGIDTVLIAQGTNDRLYDVDEISLEAHVEDFLSTFRSTHPTIRLYLLVPFAGFARPTITNAFQDYQRSMSDENSILIDIQPTGELLEALDGDSLFSTYSEDGLHPNPMGQKALAELIIAALSRQAST